MEASEQAQTPFNLEPNLSNLVKISSNMVVATTSPSITNTTMLKLPLAMVVLEDTRNMDSKVTITSTSREDTAQDTTKEDITRHMVSDFACLLDYIVLVAMLTMTSS